MPALGMENAGGREQQSEGEQKTALREGPAPRPHSAFSPDFSKVSDAELMQ